MAPESLRPPVARACVLAALLMIAASPVHALRLLDYNILNYPGTSAATRDPSFRTIIASVRPDIIVTEETNSQVGVDTFLNDVLNVIEPGQWAALPFIDGNDTDAGLFYKPSKFSTPTQLWFYPNGANLLRLIHEYIVHPLGYTSQASEIRLYACHLKASTGTVNVNQRFAEATGWRDSMNANPPGTHAIALGDFNFYSGTEIAFSKLLETQADNDGQLYDPLGLQGIAWQNNASMAIHHTQSPCLTAPCAPGASTGGLDDRFDLILPTTNWNDGTGYEVIADSMISVGNDGLHLNLNITDAPVIPEGVEFAAAIKSASDHLPLRVDFQVPAIGAVAASLDLGTAIGSASASLAVSNTAIAPADGLSCTLSASAGFSAPGGTLEVVSGATANPAIGTTVGGFGPRAGTLTVVSDDLDQPTRVVALSANILDHAHASLDSTAEQTVGSIDFGTLPAAAFTPATVAVHNAGYTAMQARLVLSGVTILGGDGRFSQLGGNATATIADVGERFDIAFDPAGATPDSVYTATLTFDGADEPLPGATPGSPLTVSLTAQVSAAPLAAPAVPTGPVRTRLYAPFPNPLTASSRIWLDLSHGAELRLDVVDLTGRRVATLAQRTCEPGRYSFRWAGDADGGAPVPSGIYFIRATGPGLPALATRVAVVR